MTQEQTSAGVAGQLSGRNGGEMTMKRVVVVGAGPIGLHAALQAVQHGFDVTVLERGDVAAAVRRWGHIPLFTPFSMNSTAEGRRIAAQSGTLPDSDALLTGAEYIRQYLLPLARCSTLQDKVHTGTELLSASRQGLGKSDLIGNPERAS